MFIHIPFLNLTFHNTEFFMLHFHIIIFQEFSRSIEEFYGHIVKFKIKCLTCFKTFPESVFGKVIYNKMGKTFNGYTITWETQQFSQKKGN